MWSLFILFLGEPVCCCHLPCFIQTCNSIHQLEQNSLLLAEQRATCGSITFALATVQYVADATVDVLPKHFGVLLCNNLSKYTWTYSVNPALQNGFYLVGQVWKLSRLHSTVYAVHIAFLCTHEQHTGKQVRFVVSKFHLCNLVTASGQPVQSASGSVHTQVTNLSCLQVAN
jgi:hypothetical protein